MLNIATERGMKVIDFMDRKDLIKWDEQALIVRRQLAARRSLAKSVL